MKITIIQLPDISEYINYTYSTQIGEDSSVIMLFKRLYRSDIVLVDVYLNEITDTTKVISGIKVTAGSIISAPRYDLNFPYYIHCIDQDGVDEPVKQDTLYQFYFQFTNYDGGDWII